MKNIIIFLKWLIITSFCLVSCENQQTNTPSQYRNTNHVSIEQYEADKKVLIGAVETLIADEKYLPKMDDDLQYKKIFIDSIFYSDNSRIAFTTILLRYNGLAKLVDADSDGTEYYGTAFIGIRHDEIGIEIINDLYYHTSQSETYTDASKRLRWLYFNKLQDDEGIYNINDVRFWECKIWN